MTGIRNRTTPGALRGPSPSGDDEAASPPSAADGSAPLGRTTTVSGFERLGGARPGAGLGVGANAVGGPGSSRGGPASAASRAGFLLLERYRGLSQGARKATVAAAAGFLLLLPPVGGQLMHPGAPKAQSPLAMMVSEKASQPTGARVRQETARLATQVPGGKGHARELALRAMIDHHDSSARSAGRLEALSGDAAKQLARLRETVGLDARMGYAVDCYWFGVPDEHARYHAGIGDARTITDQAADVRSAAREARASTRQQISEFLKEESPAYAELHRAFSHEKLRLTRATEVRDQAGAASDALGTASHAVMMRNLTSRTKEEDVYTTRITRNRDGTTSTTQVKTGTRTVDNPDWHTWNMLAVAAKARAESRVHELNVSVRANRELLGIDGRVGADLLGIWDALGHPSFLVWSFDSGDVSRGREASDAMVRQLNGLIRRVHGVLDPLEQKVEAALTARWDQLAGKGPRPDVPDDAPRAQRTRPLDDGGGSERPS
jgi:hypothetical protein